MATGVKKSAKSRISLLPVIEGRKAEALYLYGISPAMKARAEIKMLGIDGEHGVEAISCAGMICWVTPVDAVDFAAELNRKMEELEWLAESSVRHQRVVAAIGKKTTLLPTRFGTIFLSEESLINDVKSRAKDLAAAFKRIQDADEWGIKVFLTAHPKQALVEATTGKDYLQKKAQAIAASGKPAPDAAIAGLAEELRSVTVASTTSSKVSSGQQGLQWQSSFLLARKNRKKWDKILKKYATRWADSRRIEASGPWPPYSFVE